MTEHDANWKRGKNHHFLLHDLPRLSQKAVLNLIGASSIKEALCWLESKKPAELREMFEKVYKATTKSQNKRWLQRRLAEALKLKPSDYFPLGQKIRVKTKTTKDGLDSYPSSSSAAAAEAQEDSVEVEPVRKSARVSKRRAFLRSASANEQPETPTGAEVDAPFGGPGSEEGNAESENAVVATLESPKYDPSTATATAEDDDGDDMDNEDDDYSSHLSSPPASPCLHTSPSMPPPPALSAADAFKLLAKRGPGAHTKESAAEVAAIVAAKRRLKVFLPGYPLDCVSEQHLEAVTTATVPILATVPTAAADVDPCAEHIYTGPVYPYNLVRQTSALVGFGEELNSIVLGTMASTGADTADDSGNAFIAEGEDEIFMNLDPVLVDMDMSLLPDGRMW